MFDIPSTISSKPAKLEMLTQYSFDSAITPRIACHVSKRAVFTKLLTISQQSQTSCVITILSKEHVKYTRIGVIHDNNTYKQVIFIPRDEKSPTNCHFSICLNQDSKNPDIGNRAIGNLR